MPRSLPELLDNAEALADAFEAIGPDDVVETFDGAPLRRVLAAARARVDAEREALAAVAAARAAGIPWDFLGSYLGTSGEAARQRHGRLVAQAGARHAQKSDEDEYA
jgi:hypothetical protein